MSMSRLTPEEMRSLEEDRILLSAPQNGNRKVSAAMLSPPSSHSSQSSSSRSSASVRYQPFNAAGMAFDLPEALESVAAFEFLGFTKKTAGEIFARWVARGEDSPDSILDYALGRLGMLNIPQMQNLPPTQTMANLGISEELQNALMDPRFKHISESQTLGYWLRDTIISRYAALDKLLDRLKKHAVQTVAKKKQHKRAKLSGVFRSAAGSSAQQPPAQQPQAASPTATASLIHTPEDDYLPQAHVTMAAPGPLLPNHIVLWKGKGVNELNSAQLPFPFFGNDGNMDMNAIRTFPGGDFNQEFDAWYWTAEFETAEKYRRWAAHRNNYGETWIIRIQVPNEFLVPLNKTNLWFSPDWKEYVWYCKKGTNVGYPPARLDRYWRGADIIEGHIVGRSPTRYPKIDKSEVQTKITEEDVMKIGNRKATQWVVMKKSTADFMAVNIRGKTHIEVYPPEFNFDAATEK